MLKTLATIKSKHLQTGNSLVVQWLGLCAFTARAQVQSLVRELRSHKPLGAAKKKEKIYKLNMKCKTHNIPNETY